MMKALGIALLTATFVWPQGMKEVQYEVDGTAKYVNLTLTNKDGGTEQNQVKLPFELRFYARSGQFVYLSAQKAKAIATVLRPGSDREVVYDGIAGTVHVSIKVTGTVLQEATSDAPHGIAKAEGRIPD